MRRVGRLHVLTDTTLQTRFSHEELARLAIEGGADTIQFREKRATTRELIRDARALADLCRRRGVALIVNDRVDVALAADAAGVHLGQDDFPIALARRLLGPDRVIGGSATTIEQAREVMRAGADYVGFGAVFATGSKQDASAPRGLDTLREICGELEIPVIAIGGIGLDRIAAVMGSGAHGVAVISAVVLAADPREAASAARRAIDGAAGAPRSGGAPPVAGR